MSSIGIKILIADKSPAPKPGINKSSPLEVLEKVKDFIDDIEAGCSETSHQWNYLKSLFLALQARNRLSEIELDLLELVEPIIMKYCEFDPDLAAKIDGHKLNRRNRNED